MLVNIIIIGLAITNLVIFLLVKKQKDMFDALLSDYTILRQVVIEMRKGQSRLKKPTIH